jgi:hypothetical protein
MHDGTRKLMLHSKQRPSDNGMEVDLKSLRATTDAHRRVCTWTAKPNEPFGNAATRQRSRAKQRRTGSSCVEYHRIQTRTCHAVVAAHVKKQTISAAVDRTLLMRNNRSARYLFIVDFFRSNVKPRVLGRGESLYHVHSRVWSAVATNLRGKKPSRGAIDNTQRRPRNVALVACGHRVEHQWCE